MSQIPRLHARKNVYTFLGFFPSVSVWATT